MAINAHLMMRNGPTIGVWSKTRSLPWCLSPAEHYRGRDTVSEIFTIFHFPLKSKMAAKSGETEIFPPAQDSPAVPF